MVGVDKERVQVAVPRRVPPEHVDVAVLVRVLADLAPLLVAPGVPVDRVAVPRRQTTLWKSAALPSDDAASSLNQTHENALSSPRSGSKHRLRCSYSPRHQGCIQGAFDNEPALNVIQFECLEIDTIALASTS